MQLASAQVGEAAKTLTETKEKKPSLLSRAWGGIKKGAAYVGGAISGKLNSLKRQHQRAVDDLNHHREDYKAMSRTDRFLWTLKNPLAPVMASGSMGGHQGAGRPGQAAGGEGGGVGRRCPGGRRL